MLNCWRKKCVYFPFYVQSFLIPRIYTSIFKLHLYKKKVKPGSHTDRSHFLVSARTYSISRFIHIQTFCVYKQNVEKWYVDNVISAVSRNEAEGLLLHLNSVEPSIQFTLECEKDKHLPFLDLNVSNLS